MRSLAVAFSAWTLCVCVAEAQASPVSVTLGGRMQFQWNSTSVDAADAGVSALASHTFETRRVRLTAGVRVGDWIRGEIEPEFAMAQVRLRNAWIGFEPGDGVFLRAGQMKKPFGLMEMTSSTTFPLIERGLRIRGLDALARRSGSGASFRGATLLGEHHSLLDALGYSGYDLGVTLEARAGGLHASTGMYNGSGSDTRDENDDKSLAARLTYAPSQTLPLQFGVSWSHRDLSIPETAPVRSMSGNAFAAELQYGGFRSGPWLLAELSTGDNLLSDERFTSAQAVAAWFFGLDGTRVEGIEPAFRVSWADPDAEQSGDGGVLITPGVNLYFFGRNRLMLNADVYLPESDDVSVQHALRAQVNLHF